VADASVRIIRPHRMRSADAVFCDRRHTQRGLSISVLGTLVYWCTVHKTAESIEMPFGADSYEPKEPCIRWGVKSGQIHFSRKG